MGNNTETQVTVNLSITDLITPGLPATYSNSSGPTIFNAKLNGVFQYLIVEPGTQAFPIVSLPAPVAVGVIYIKNVSDPSTPIPNIELQINSVNLIFPLGPGGVFLYVVPGNSGAVGIPLNGTGLQSLIASCTAETKFEYLISL